MGEPRGGLQGSILEDSGSLSGCLQSRVWLGYHLHGTPRPVRADTRSLGGNGQLLARALGVQRGPQVTFPLKARVLGRQGASALPLTIVQRVERAQVCSHRDRAPAAGSLSHSL